MTLKDSPRTTAERRREREMQYELLKFHRDQTDPIATNITKKRVREPRVDLKSNPFCADRQLADSYQQLNFNKVQSYERQMNPRFYSISVQDGARVEQNPRNHSSFINPSADSRANSHFDARARPEFSTLPPATTYTPAVAQFAVPKVVSVDPSNLRKHSNSKNGIESSGIKDAAASNRPLFPPGHDQYSAHLTSQSVTFGHRPSSAARMFDHLSNNISGINSPRNPSSKTSSRRASSTPVRTGMSVMELAQLLAPAKSTKSSSFGSKSSTRASQRWKAGSTATSIHSGEAFSLDKEVDDELERQDTDKKKKARELELERGYINYVYNPPHERKPGQFTPPDQTTAQLIDKYRKLAVGKMPDIF